MSLEKWGWSPRWQAALDRLREGLEPGARGVLAGRVLRQDRGWLRVATATGERLSRISGRLTHGAADALALPVVGDWVALLPAATAREATVVAVLPRQSALVRRAAGSDAPQAIAANAEVVFLVHGLDQPLSVRRLERALAVVRSSGAEAVVVLNKLDLGDAPRASAEVRTVAAEVRVLAVSAALEQGLDALSAALPPGRTGVLLGPSGAGKSTLVNLLLGEQRLATGAVRERDRKGRHTTTRRELVRLPSGAWLIDGPGIRELGLLEGNLAETFPEIEALAVACRFRDCAHASEPGCAVRGAVASGALDAARFESFQALTRELGGAPPEPGRGGRTRGR